MRWNAVTDLFGNRLQHNHVPLIPCNHLIERLHLGGVGHRNAGLLDFVAPVVSDGTPVDDDFGVIASEAVVGIGGLRQVVHGIARRQRNIEAVRLNANTAEFERIFAWLFTLRNSDGFYSQYARTNQKQPSGVFRIVGSDEVVLEAERLIQLA